MLFGCYKVDVYCDYHSQMEGGRWRPDPDIATGDTRGACIRELRADGWLIGKTHKCPACVAERRTDPINPALIDAPTSDTSHTGKTRL